MFAAIIKDDSQSQKNGDQSGNPFPPKDFRCSGPVSVTLRLRAKRSNLL
jgi:hypothetical protein